MRTLVTNPLIPESLWATLAFLSAAVVVLYMAVHPPRVSLRRKILIGVLISLIAAGLLALLLNPTWEELDRAEFGRPAMSVVMDTSGSMATADCSGRSRLEVARENAEKLRDDLKGEFDVRLWRFDESLRPVDANALDSLETAGAVTDLAGALQTVLQSGMTGDAAVVLLSDGIHNLPGQTDAMGAAVQTARAMAVPVYTRCIGTDAMVEDLELLPATPDDVAFINQTVSLRVLARYSGGRGRPMVDVSLHQEGREIAAQTVTIGEDGMARVEFPVKAEQVGLFRYEAQVQPLGDEIVRANNRCVFSIRVIDTPIRVLVFEGKPYWDTKFLLRRLSETAGIELTSVIQMKGGRFLLRRHAVEPLSGNPEERRSETVSTVDLNPFLKDFDEIRETDIIILGREVQSMLDAQGMETLCRWVGEWGGSLICARGKPLQVMTAVLDRVMPVRWSTGVEKRFRMYLDPDAATMGWFPETAPLLPSLATESVIAEEKPLANVVARVEPENRDASASVCWQSYGAGRVVVLEGSGTWRWAFLPPAEADLKDIYDKYWTSLLRWLVASAEFLPGETARLRPAQSAFPERGQATLFLMSRNDPEIGPNMVPTVEVSSLDRAAEPPRTVLCVPGTTPGAFQAAIPDLPRGAYTAQVVRRGQGHPVQCVFDVVEPMAERLDLRARSGLLKRLAEESGGGVLEDNPAGQIKAAYLEYWKERHPEQFRREPAWDAPTVLLSLLGLAGILWIVRRRGGLI
jgi:hypothetical protein